MKGYKDCKTQEDFAEYRKHCERLDADHKTAVELLNQIISVGRLEMVDGIVAIIRDIEAERDAYTADENNERLDMMLGL